jgi:hypothetical protein
VETLIYLVGGGIILCLLYVLLKPLFVKSAPKEDPIGDYPLSPAEQSSGSLALPPQEEWGVESEEWRRRPPFKPAPTMSHNRYVPSRDAEKPKSVTRRYDDDDADILIPTAFVAGTILDSNSVRETTPAPSCPEPQGVTPHIMSHDSSPSYSSSSFDSSPSSSDSSPSCSSSGC